MDKNAYIEECIIKYNDAVYKGEMPQHNINQLRRILSEEYDYWEGEEARVLKDSNRYHDDN